MKRFLIIVFIIFIFVYLYDYKEYNISDDEIRFRVISNSNNTKDIIMKEKVVDNVAKLLFINSSNKNVIRENIYNNLEVMENSITKLFKENNYDKNFNIIYGINSFPSKYFMGKHYNSGNYESLVIEIGEAKGNNYFCILYPSLCIIDYEKKEENNSYKLKIIDVFKKIF